MIWRAARTPMATWLILIGLTLASVLAGKTHAFGGLTPVFIAIAALLKAGLVVMNFMEFGRRDTVWWRLYGVWLLAAACLLLSTGI